MHIELTRLSFGWMSEVLGLRVRVRRGERVRPGRTVTVDVAISVPDVRDGVVREFVEPVRLDPAGSAETWAPALRAAIHRRLLHEADECIHVDGRMVFDPHGRVL